MNDSDKPTISNPPPQVLPSPPSRWQFSLGWLVFVTTVVAAMAGLLRAFDAPGIVRVALAIYLLVFAPYLLMRLPFLLRPLMKNSPQRRAIAAHREALAQWAEQQREQAKASAEDDSPSS